MILSLQLVMIHYNLLNCDYDSLLSTGTGKKYNSPSSVTLVKAKHVEQNISLHGVLRVVCVTIFLNANENKELLKITMVVLSTTKFSKCDEYILL